MKRRTALLLALSFFYLSAPASAQEVSSYTISIPIRAESLVPSLKPEEDCTPRLTFTPSPAPEIAPPIVPEPTQQPSPAAAPTFTIVREHIQIVAATLDADPEPPVTYAWRMDSPLYYDVGEEGSVYPRQAATITLELYNRSNRPLLVELMDANDEDVRSQYRELCVEPPTEWGPAFVLEPLDVCAVSRDILPFSDDRGVREEDAVVGLPALTVSVRWEPLPASKVEIHLDVMRTGGYEPCKNSR